MCRPADHSLVVLEMKEKTLEQMDVLFGDRLVPHALQHPEGSKAAEKEIGGGVVQVEGMKMMWERMNGYKMDLYHVISCQSALLVITVKVGFM